MLFSIGKAAGISKLKITSPKKNITQEMIKDLYKAKGYVSKNRNVKKVKNKKDDKPKGLMSRTKGDK